MAGMHIQHQTQELTALREWAGAIIPKTMNCAWSHAIILSLSRVLPIRMLSRGSFGYSFINSINGYITKTKISKIKYCINDIYVEIEDHRNILNQNPVVNIARIFNNFPVPIKMIEDGNEFICKVKEIVWKYQYYDMKEFYSCKFD